jgi:hypothetical protein
MAIYKQVQIYFEPPHEFLKRIREENSQEPDNSKEQANTDPKEIERLVTTKNEL